jgi:ATP-dependent RNA helicase RhlE
MAFTSLGLYEALLRPVAGQGYGAPTPTQARVIPAVLEGRELLAAVQTGIGRAAAFALPLLQRLLAVIPPPNPPPAAPAERAAYPEERETC